MHRRLVIQKTKISAESYGRSHISWYSATPLVSLFLSCLPKQLNHIWRIIVKKPREKICQKKKPWIFLKQLCIGWRRKQNQQKPREKSKVPETKCFVTISLPKKKTMHTPSGHKSTPAFCTSPSQPH
jgi:hypothetical protein